MKSSLNIIDFKNKLTELTSIGDPNLNGTPLAVLTPLKSLKKVFYGKFNNNSFRLTSNGFTRLTPYIIKGNFEQIGNETEVNYKISPIWFGYLWIRFLPIIAIIYLNLIKFKELSWFEKIAIYVPINLFLFAILIISIIQTNMTKKELEEIFIKNFLIK